MVIWGIVYEMGFIMVYHGLSWFIMVYHGLSWFIMVYHGLSHMKSFDPH